MLNTELTKLRKRAPGSLTLPDVAAFFARRRYPRSSTTIGEFERGRFKDPDARFIALYAEAIGMSVRAVEDALRRTQRARAPFPRRIMPRIQESPPDRLQADEVRAVLAIGEPHAFIIRFALETGLRWAEMCRARREHVENGMLTVSRTKSGKVRRVPLNAHFEAELRARGPGRFVLFTEGSAGSFNKVVRRRSGVERFHVHQLRHTFACTWLERGGSLPALQQILGHASVTTTQQYARLSDDSVRSEAARVNGSRIADWRLPASEGSHDQDGSVSRTAVPMSLK
jgi:integrase